MTIAVPSYQLLIRSLSIGFGLVAGLYEVSP